MERKTPTIGVVGLGHVGLATALAFTHYGSSVAGYDTDVIVRSRVARGRLPFHEPGMGPALARAVRAGQLQVCPSVAELVSSSRLVLLCVPTPATDRAEVDLSALESSVRSIGQALRESRRSTNLPTIVVKSTVPPGTSDRVVLPWLASSSGLEPREFSVASNPEFLSEGSMLADAIHPARIVIGANRASTARLLTRIYRPFRAPIFHLSPSAAELSKYASNAFLALKVNFANELARLSELLGTDVDEVLSAVGADPRIGSSFLSAGPGYGGSCFSKDLGALLALARNVGAVPRVLTALPTANDDQVQHSVDLVLAALPPSPRPTVGVLGLSFKEGTDDVRESRAFPFVERLSERGIFTRLHDPVAIPRFQQEWQFTHQEGLPSTVSFHASTIEALRGAHVAAILVAWKEYQRWPRSWIGAMAPNPVIVDLRRCLAPAFRKLQGIRWIGLGVGTGRVKMPMAGPDPFFSSTSQVVPSSKRPN